MRATSCATPRKPVYYNDLTGNCQEKNARPAVRKKPRPDLCECVPRLGRRISFARNCAATAEDRERRHGLLTGMDRVGRAYSFRRGDRHEPSQQTPVGRAAACAAVQAFASDSVPAAARLGIGGLLAGGEKHSDDLIAVLSGICYAGVFMMNTGKNADAISSCFLGQLAAGIIFTPLCFGETDFSLPVTAAVTALGVVQVGGAYILFSIGIKNTPAVTASLLTGLEPIMNPLLVAAFYGERVTTLSIIGSVIVVCSILTYNVCLTKRKPAGTEPG